MSECNYRVWQWPRCRVLVCSSCSLNIACKSRRQLLQAIWNEMKKTKSFLWCIRFWQHLDGDVTYNLSFCSVYSKCGNWHIFHNLFLTLIKLCLMHTPTWLIFHVWTSAARGKMWNQVQKVQIGLLPSAPDWWTYYHSLPKPPYADFVGLQNMTLTLAGVSSHQCLLLWFGRIKLKLSHYTVSFWTQI